VREAKNVSWLDGKAWSTRACGIIPPRSVCMKVVRRVLSGYLYNYRTEFLARAGLIIDVACTKK